MSAPTPARIVKITVAFHLEVESFVDESSDRFHFEENHCVDNHVTLLADRIAASPNYCQTCRIGSCFLGHLPFDKMRELASGDAETQEQRIARLVKEVSSRPALERQAIMSALYAVACIYCGDAGCRAMCQNDE